MTITHETWHGVRAHRLESEVVSVVVLPSRGAKIASIVDPAGREWLAQPVAGDLVPVGPGDRFGEAEMSGWDEMAPTVRSPRRADHGEVWSVPWTVVSEDATTLELEVEGHDTPFILRRRLELTATGFRLDYEASVHTGAVDFLWMAHPQFQADPSSTVVTPPLLALAEVPHGTGRKAWCPPDSTPEQATLVHSDGARLTLAWEVGHVPFLAVWVDHCRGSREPVVALEPSLGFGDDVDAAAARGQTTRLVPNSPIAWSLEVRLCPAPPSGRGVDRG